MDEGQDTQNNLLDTTDCLEAIGVFKGWKNGLFIIAILCLLVLQVSFWLVNTGFVKADDKTKSDITAVAAEKDLPVVVADDTEQIKEAAKQVVQDSNLPTKAAPDQQQARPRFSIKVEHLAWLIRFSNFALILAAMLYCLTMLFSLKVSLLGRLGGINHISRAFFLSLAFLVLLLPWQKLFAGVVAGAIYTPEELLTSHTAVAVGEVFEVTLYYLRFTGYWFLVLLLLIFSQIRSARWAKAILRRLEVI